MNVVVYQIGDKKRARKLAVAVVEGLRRHGIGAPVLDRADDQAQADVAIAYGWHPGLYGSIRARGGHFVFLDNGMCGGGTSAKGFRHEYNRVAVDDWSPTLRMRRGCPADRWRELQLTMQPRPVGAAVLVTGMSRKAAKDFGFQPHQWEQAAIDRLRAVTDAPIIYRTKIGPTDPPAHVNGASVEDHRARPIEAALRSAAALVTHHSNTAVDAMIAGVPAYCERGIGTLVSSASVEDAATAPRVLDDGERRQFLADVAYCQWSNREIHDGEMWAYVRGLM